MSKEALDAWMAKHPRTYDFPEELLPAVRAVESAGDDRAVSKKGAVGPMQIVASAHGLEPSDVADPAVNLDVGARILDNLQGRFKDTTRALKAYNRGPDAERKHEDTPPKETTDYIARIAKWQKQHPVKSEWDDPKVKLPDMGVTSMKQWEAKYPLLDIIGKGVKSVMDFAEKNNPPVKMLFDATGARSVPKVADMVAYGVPLTTGSGETLQIKPDVVDAAMVAAPIASKALKAGKFIAEAPSVRAGSAAAQRGILGPADKPTRSLAELMKDEPYTLKSIEGLVERSGKKGIISVQAIKDELNRPGISKAEKDVLTPFTMQDGVVKADDLIQGMKASTKDFTLTPHTHDKHAAYGLENIDRIEKDDLTFNADNMDEIIDYFHLHIGMPLEEARQAAQRQINIHTNDFSKRTTTWRLPKDVSGNMGNHFQDPDYFGHTRAFEENGIPHVVEVQSDLMQHKPLEGAKRLAAEDELQKAVLDIPELKKKIKAITDEIDKIKRPLGPGYVNDNEAMDKIGILRDQQRALPTIQSQELKRDELLSKLRAGRTEKDIEPMRKTHVERLVKEELNMANQNGQGVVRFAAPDTVAKVERWRNATAVAVGQIAAAKAKLPKAGPESAEFLNSIIEKNKEILKYIRPNQLKLAEETRDRHIEQLASREKFKDVSVENTKILEEEIKSDELAVNHFKKHLNDPVDAPLFSPEEHGIYDNYKDMEKYLKSIGGTDHVDMYGHRWIEVPVKGAKSPVKSGRVPMFSMTGAAALGTGYNAPKQEP